jgi:iron complex outermembrane receptor protein
MSATFMKRTPLALAMLALPSLVLAQGAGAGPTLPPVVVSGDTDSATPLLSPSATRLRQQLERTPGGVNLVAPQEKVRLNTLQDAIGGEPGIVVQEFFGGQDQPRLNIRGSGIQSNPVNRGVLLLQDGLPLNEADGSFVISTLEPRNSALVSVRRGANAQSAAASTLGGELDFQSLVGGQANHVRLDAGSFGRKGLTAGIGGQGEYWDGRIFVSHDEADGYRHHSASERSSLHANAGWRSSGIENRTYLSYTDLGFDIPNVIPKARLQSDPRSVLGDYNTPVDQANNIYLRDPNRQTRQLRLANRTAWGGEALSHTVGVYWQSIDDTFTSPAMSSPTDGHTTGLQWTTRGQSGALAYRAGLDWARTSMQRDMHPINACRRWRATTWARRTAAPTSPWPGAWRRGSKRPATCATSNPYAMRANWARAGSSTSSGTPRCPRSACSGRPAMPPACSPT